MIAALLASDHADTCVVIVAGLVPFALALAREPGLWRTWRAAVARREP